MRGILWVMGTRGYLFGNMESRGFGIWKIEGIFGIMESFNGILDIAEARWLTFGSEDLASVRVLFLGNREMWGVILGFLKVCRELAREIMWIVFLASGSDFRAFLLREVCVYYNSLAFFICTWDVGLQLVLKKSRYRRFQCKDWTIFFSVNACFRSQSPDGIEDTVIISTYRIQHVLLVFITLHTRCKLCIIFVAYWQYTLPISL